MSTHMYPRYENNAVGMAIVTSSNSTGHYRAKETLRYSQTSDVGHNQARLPSKVLM